MVGSTSEVGKGVLDALKGLTKHIPPGAVSPGQEGNQLRGMQQKNMQNGQQLAALRQMQGGPDGGGGAPPPGAGGPPGA